MSGRARGFSLVEVLVAALIIGVAVVPLLQLFPGTFGTQQISGDHLRLAAVGVRKSEEIINRLRSDITSVVSGAETCTDLPNCRVEWTIATEASSAVAGVGSLRTLTTIACQDQDASNSCDAGEPQARYDTKITSRP